MATVALLLDAEEGHVLATLRLAKGLRARGHAVCYLGLAGTEDLARQQGFDFLPILAEETGAGARTSLLARASFDLEMALVAGGLDRVIERLRPDVLLLLSLYYLEALIVERRYRLPVVLLTPQYRPERRASGVEKALTSRLLGMRSEAVQKVLALVSGGDLRLRSFGDLARLVLPIPELVLLPREFDLPELAADPDVTYVGAGVDLVRAEEPFPWDALNPRLPLVYCSLGSQADVAPEPARRFFHCVIEAAAARPDLQFVLALGRGFPSAGLPERPPNLYLAGWVPQMTLLGRAALMVSHAGVGTVKECILQGVPLVVLPLMRDQFDAARRVVHHGLGVEGDLKRLTHGELLALIDRVAGDPAYRQRVNAMRERFLEGNDAQPGVRLIEEVLARGTQSAGGASAAGAALRHG